MCSCRSSKVKQSLHEYIPLIITTVEVPDEPLVVQDLSHEASHDDDHQQHDSSTGLSETVSATISMQVC